MRLGKQQRKILELMTQDWQLGLSLGLHPHYWIQKGGLGKGGEANHNLNQVTCLSLVKNGYIRVAYRKFPTEAFELSALGLELLKESKENAK